MYFCVWNTIINHHNHNHNHQYYSLIPSVVLKQQPELYPLWSDSLQEISLLGDPGVIVGAILSWILKKYKGIVYTDFTSFRKAWMFFFLCLCSVTAPWRWAERQSKKSYNYLYDSQSEKRNELQGLILKG